MREKTATDIAYTLLGFFIIVVCIYGMFGFLSWISYQLYLEDLVKQTITEIVDNNVFKR